MSHTASPPGAMGCFQSSSHDGSQNPPKVSPDKYPASVTLLKMNTDSNNQVSLARPREAGVAGSALSGLGMTEGWNQGDTGLRAQSDWMLCWGDQTCDCVQLTQDTCSCPGAPETSRKHRLTILDTHSVTETVLGPLSAYFV